MHRINEQITSKQVRIDGVVYELKEALKLANDLDLVEVNSQVTPSICKIINYEKFLYEQKKKKDTKKVLMKEIKFGPDIAENDISHKLNQAKKFIKDGHKVKLTVTFSGRNIIYKDKGEAVLNKFKESLNDISKVEGNITLENKKMNLTLCKK